MLRFLCFVLFGSKYEGIEDHGGNIYHFDFIPTHLALMNGLGTIV